MSGPLSIALLSHLASEVAPTGAERSLALLATGLHRRGHRVGVVAPGAAWALGPSLAAAGVPVETIPTRACWMTYHDPRPWPVALLKWLRWARPPSGTGRLTAFLRRFRPDVVHVNCLPHLRGAAAAGAAGVPLVWHLREILPAGPRRRWLAGHLRRRAGTLVAVSEAVGAWVRDEGLGDRLQVIPNGVDVDANAPAPAAARESLGLAADGLLVGLFGQLIPHKGAEVFVEAARRALGMDPGLRFVLAGGGPAVFRRRIAAAITATGHGERFDLLPPQPDGRVLFAAADVVCLTTTTPDPLPRVVMEAMAAGRPVVAFPSGGTTEMVQPETTGILVPSGDVDALAGALVRLAREPALCRAMGAAGRRRALDCYSVDRHLDRMEAVFRERAS